MVETLRKIQSTGEAINEAEVDYKGTAKKYAKDMKDGIDSN